MKIKKPLLGLLVCASALLSVDKAYAATASVSMGRMHMTVLDSQKCSMQRWERPSLEHLMLSILTAKKYQNPT